ncbi:MAG TPA: type VI secretion system ATPase TssH, partial [Paludibacteraceae bacterium]|nr:type VI secretion system ATPase TssH [Paludibacteraceae bacterium]
FKPLDRSQIEDIVRLQLDDVRRMLEQNGIQLEATDRAVKFIADNGYDPQFGARPVKRAIQRLILNDLSKQIIAGQVVSNQVVIVDADENGIVFRNK